MVIAKIVIAILLIGMLMNAYTDYTIYKLNACRDNRLVPRKDRKSRVIVSLIWCVIFIIALIL